MEFYTGSAITTGDFDIVTARQEELEEELRRNGFTKPVGIGHTPLGWVHPELRLGFEVVSATLLDGQADRARVRLIDTGEDGVVSFVSLEDMIADRMGQYASGTAPEMLYQARALFALYPDADRDYMDAASGMKRLATMASKRSKDDPPQTLEAFGEALAMRRAAVEARSGPLVVPRNAGTRRTPSKRALLKAIDAAGGEW